MQFNGIFDLSPILTGLKALVRWSGEHSDRGSFFKKTHPVGGSYLLLVFFGLGEGGWGVLLCVGA